jgi:hypothetical protein
MWWTGAGRGRTTARHYPPASLERGCETRPLYLPHSSEPVLAKHPDVVQKGPFRFVCSRRQSEHCECAGLGPGHRPREWRRTAPGARGGGVGAGAAPASDDRCVPAPSKESRQTGAHCPLSPPPQKKPKKQALKFNALAAAAAIGAGMLRLRGGRSLSVLCAEIRRLISCANTFRGTAS